MKPKATSKQAPLKINPKLMLMIMGPGKAKDMREEMKEEKAEQKGGEDKGMKMRLAKGGK